MSESKLTYQGLLLDRLSSLFASNTASFTRPATKKRVVILGTGWGAHALLKSIDADAYDVTVISPRNYFVFTPMLAGAATGTVESRSITESIRDANPRANYLEATAMEINPDSKEVVCQSVICEGASCTIDEFIHPYDDLVITVGASVNTFGIKGVKDHCYFLKQVPSSPMPTNLQRCAEWMALVSRRRPHAILSSVQIRASPTPRCRSFSRPISVFSDPRR